MRCCVPFCGNTSTEVSLAEGNGVNFYKFPREESLRKAWLRALGKPEASLPDSAVVCSNHFLYDDICETESGLRQLRSGAIPSTVQVCMICLAIDRKMILMSKHNLREAYEKITGYPLCDGGKLRQTLCVHCAQRLRNFSRFRENCLRVRYLMMELVEKQEVITIPHIIRMRQCTNNHLKNNLVSTTLGPDSCDLYIVEYSDEDKQTNSEETVETVVVKIERGDDIVSVDEDTQVIKEENCNADCVDSEFHEDLINYESALYMCKVSHEEFSHEHADSAHVMHPDGDAGDVEGDAPSNSSLKTGRDDVTTTRTSTGSKGPRRKNAQYYRDYRARKRAEEEKELLNSTSDPSTTADSSTIKEGRDDEATTSIPAGLKGPRRKTAQYYRDYRARKRAEQENGLLNRTSDIGFAKPRRRKTPAEYQREYRARKKAQRESRRAAKTNDGSMGGS